ncbi:MAG: tetratricopeptide repeat protein [Dongiaceae bacterium]
MAFASILLMIGVVLAVMGTIRMRRRLQPRTDTDSPEYFRERCQRLLEMNKLDELIAYARERLKKRPNHTYAHWYLGRAFYLQQKWAEALRAFNEVARLDPSWIEDSVTPYVRAIESKLKPRELPIAPEAPEQQRTLH